MRRLTTHALAFLAGLAAMFAAIVVDEWLSDRALDRLADDE